MNERERRSEGGLPSGTPSGAWGGGRLGEVRRRAQGHLDAADDAITRALSGDSEAFVRASRQRGGQ